MPSLIAKQPKDTKKQTTISLSGSVLSDLELYCRFIESGRDWVVNEALKNVFRKDKDFLDWKEQHAPASLERTDGADEEETRENHQPLAGPMDGNGTRRSRAGKAAEAASR